MVNISGALDQASRTLLTEIRMKNPEDLLRPGMYADVRLHIERDSPPLLIPTSALIIRAGGPRVAVVGADQKIRFQLVDLGRDYGATVEIIRGITPQDRLVNSPPDGLQDGSAVRIAKAVITTPPTPATPAPAAPPAAPPSLRGRPQSRGPRRSAWRRPGPCPW